MPHTTAAESPKRPAPAQAAEDEPPAATPVTLVFSSDLSQLGGDDAKTVVTTATTVSSTTSLSSSSSATSPTNKVAACAARPEQPLRSSSPRVSPRPPQTTADTMSATTTTATLPLPTSPILENNKELLLLETQHGGELEVSLKKKADDDEQPKPTTAGWVATPLPAPRRVQPHDEEETSSPPPNGGKEQKKNHAAAAHNTIRTPPPPTSGGAPAGASLVVRHCPPLTRRSVTMPVTNASLRDYEISPPPLRVEAWAETPAESFQVRGAQYTAPPRSCPGAGVKRASAPAALKLLTVDLVQVDQPLYETGLCGHPDERIQQALRREAETGVKELPAFVFAVNLCVPGSTTTTTSSSSTDASPAATTTTTPKRGIGRFSRQSSSSSSSPSLASSKNDCWYHCVSYLGTDHPELLQDESTPLGRVAKPFFFGKGPAMDRFRDERFKLIPRIAQGNFVVRKAVGTKPSILGKKLKQYHVLDPQSRFMEIIVDIGSDAIAQRVVKLAIGYAKSIHVDMMFLLEGQDESELPERIMGGVRLKGIDFKKRDGQRHVKSPIKS